jgi:DNA polymerase-1
VEKTGYDLKEAAKLLESAGVHLAGIAGDVMLADYLLVPEQKHGLDDLGKRYLDHPLGTALGEEAQLTWALDSLLAEKLEENGVTGVYRDIELPLVPVLADMERAGIAVDVSALQALSTELGARLAEEEKRCHALAGQEFNVASTQQLAEVLFEKLGLKGGKRTKTGWSTDADTLDKLREEHALPGAILAWRELSKLKGTYVDALPPAVNPKTGRIHTHFRQAVAATGRLSSNDPNLQNIPVRTEEGRRIRRCFVAAPGHVFLSCDYSQIELRILAHYCGDGPLCESFRNDEDIHRRTASEIFGVMPGLVTPDMRRAAKAINFGIVYGMGAFRLANDLRISRTEAQSYIDGYFARYPQVRAYMDGAIARAREKGYAETLYGRRRPNQGLDAKNPMDRAGAERIAINTPIQGTAADLIKLAMVRVHADVAGTSARLLLQVHDELVLEVPEGDVKEVAERVRAAMEGVATLCVPLKVDAGWASTWDAAH